jgi:hypothetical protein
MTLGCVTLPLPEQLIVCNYESVDALLVVLHPILQAAHLSLVGVLQKLDFPVLAGNGSIRRSAPPQAA